ncbi:MAG: hypothetical protein L6R38_004051 [Xanthoria sp. 2 TBL-2021]|nr:MAG: hypothetical protein L6R38_004051 [Xanthoria sp. 2 TBL-2021]
MEAARAREATLESPANTVQNVFRIIPLNTEARRAFDSVALSVKKGSLDPLHAQYVCITGSQPLQYRAEGTANDSGETEDEAPSSPPTMVIAGYYRFNFALPAVSKGPTWIIGRGSGLKFGPARNVDIILVAPGTKGFPGLAAAHVYLGIHLNSGAWRITAGADMLVEDEKYNAGEDVYLSQPKTRIQILDMQYLIRFEITSPQSEFDYIRERNAILTKEKIIPPYTDISGIPMQGDMVFTSIVFRQGIGSGTFGSVYEGFAPSVGELRVAKRIILKSTREVPLVEKEIQALGQFKGRPGIIELVDWRTSLNSKDLLVPYYPLDVYLIYKKGVAFNEANWSAISWDARRLLCYQLLLGLTAIHGAQCMHRDITPMNILVFPYQEFPQGTLCDFGKFCSTPTDVDTKLAAWQFLPPELQKEQKNLYDQKLDIWMLALALTYTWWPQTKNLHPRGKTDHKILRDILRQDKRSDRHLGDLIAGMMSWHSSKRPSALEALKHECLQECSAKARDAAPTTKRPHNDNDD